jgi:phage repressor protein C with HTH and peptisase S24 domain
VTVAWLVSGIGPKRSEAYTPLGQFTSTISGDGETVRHIFNLVPGAIAVSPSWIEDIIPRAPPNSIIVMYASGEAMAPTIRDGDYLLINVADRERRDGVILALHGVDRICGKAAGDLRGLNTLIVLRLQVQPDGSFRLICDNRNFEPATGDFEVYGRVVWRGGKLP